MASHQLVHQTGDRLFVTSLDISNRFGKQHKDVLRAIENLDCSPEFSRRNFAPSEYTTDRGKTYPLYEITRDGFTFLCMGFTGPHAALWKERYIAAFNAMEQALRQPAPLPTVASSLLKMNRARERQVLEMFVAGLTPTEIAKHFKVSRTLISLVVHGKYQFAPGSGAPECSPELIAAVAAKHLANEQAALAQAHGAGRPRVS